MPKVEHVSFSSVKKWYQCPYLFKLLKIDASFKEDKNAHLAFGSAMHHVCELIFSGADTDYNSEFDNSFLSELKEVPKTIIQENKQLIKEMRPQAKEIIPLIKPKLIETFGEFKVVSIEEELDEHIKEFNTDITFNGYVDLVIQTNDGKYHILDWKSTSWGWKPEKKSDKFVTYQLTFYKHFWCQKRAIDKKLVETHFVLLKRTAKKDKVEIFRVTSGDKKISNALQFLKIPITNIEKGFFPRKRCNCQTCPAFQKFC